LRCDVVGEEVTLLVHKDWSVKCTGYQKHSGVKTSKNKSANGRCQGTECKLATEYRSKLQKEEGLSRQ